jgi:hypothetical protein
MTTKNRIKTVLTLAAVAMVALAFTAGSAQATIITGTAGGNDSWNTVGNWDAGVPSGAAVDAIVNDGVWAQVNNAATPTYSGNLTLNSNSMLTMAGAAGSENAVEGASGITMNEGSEIQVNMNANVDFPPITLAGPATMSSLFGASDWQTDNYSAITGAYTLTLRHFNGHTINLNAANSFTELIVNAIDRWNLHAKAAGSLGLGDVTVNPRGDGRSAQLYLDVADTIADSATLTLNGKGFDNTNEDRITIAAGVNEVVGGLIVDSVTMPYETYDNSEDWLSGDGTLTVKAADPTLPDVDAGIDMISWSGQAVTMDPNVVNNDTTIPQRDLTYLWTAEPNGIGDPNLDVAITGANTENASVTITKTAPTGDVTVIMMTLAVTLEGENPVTDSMTIDVYDDACVAALDLGLATIDTTDLDGNCITAFPDFAVMAATWLDDYALTEAVAK